ncbi:MAG: AMP-binding protein [Myxococcota bacterium]
MTVSLLARHGPHAPVAFGPAGQRTASHLMRDAAEVARALPPAAGESQVLLVFQRDRYAMAAALLGAWRAGHAVALPPNTRREAVLAVRERPETVAVLHDTDAGLGVRVPDLLDPADARGPFEPPVLPQRAAIATVFTSGTTAEADAWPKTAGQLLGEAEVLADLFEIAPGTRVVGTVSPGHIYGLLFTVLVPLVRGSAFLRETPLHAEAVAERVAASEAQVLVTVPAHLRGLTAVAPRSLASLSRVFASTAPLPDDVARAFVERHDRAVTEIFGSTETGGVAWRERRGEVSWRPLPGVDVTVDADGRLLVDSPFLGPWMPRPYRTADLAELRSDGTFRHRGRADGIVKVGGRRVSLPAMEQHLGRLPGVREAAALAVPAAGGRGQQILVAVVSERPAAELRDALAERLEHSCLPRRIVHVDALPREDNGKLQRRRLLRLFGLGPDGRPLRWKLEWGAAVAEGAGEARGMAFPVRIPDDCAWFEGHFPGHPVMAAAVQLQELVLPCVRRARPDLGTVRRMTRLKFLGRIEPGDALRVELRWRPGRPAVEFAIRRGETTCSAGHLAFAAEEAA